MKRRISYSRLDKPKNFYRSGLSATDFRIALSGAGWITLDQAVGMLAERIPPEAKVRSGIMRNGSQSGKPISALAAEGCRDLVRRGLMNLMYHGKVEKNGSGKDATYRWVENEAAEARQDTT